MSDISKELQLLSYSGDVWVELDSTSGLSLPIENVNEGDMLESGVTVRISCGQCSCSNGALRCTKTNCSNDCQWNQWQPWGSCSSSCGTGVRYRNRTVASPGRYGGEQCHSKDFQDFELCNTQSCPCIWSQWSSWSECSQPCSSGVKTRTRTPQGECKLDVTTESALCNVHPCGSTTVSPTCSEGKSMRQCSTVSCPYTCGHVTNETCSDTLSCSTGCFCAQGQVFDETARACVTPDKCTCDLTALNCGLCSQGQCVNGIATCVPTTNCDCTWGPWSDWDPCSKACDGGVRIRNRAQATTRRGTGRACAGDPAESQACNTDRCAGCTDRFGNQVPPGDMMPSENNCEICYCSYFTNQRECVPKAPGDASNPAPQWTDWSDFSACSAPCGTGTRRRSRVCLRDCANDTRTCAPDESGRLDEDQQSCNRQDCLPPVDCQVSDWTNGTCYAQCDGINPTATGQQLRLRQITQQAANGGKACPATYEVVTCTKQCQVDCQIGAWSVWSERVKNCVGTVCNPSCGIGERQRTRPVLRPAANGGQACKDREFEPITMPCNETTCSGPETLISCATKCWRTCDDVRTNKQCQDSGCVQGCGCADDKVREGDSCVAVAACSCTNPSNASQLMPPGSVVMKECNKCTCTNGQFVCEAKSCAQDCVWSTWQKVGGCNVTCGSGEQQWTRSIATPASNGGADCTGPTAKTTDCFGDEGPCCNPNDTYVDTGRCETTCGQLLHPGQPQPQSSCQPSCQCKPGSVRDATGKCVSLQDCFACSVDGAVWPNGRVEVNRANCSRRFCLHGRLTSRQLKPSEVPPCTQADEATAAAPGAERVVDSGNCCYRAALKACAKGRTLLREARRPNGRVCRLVTPLSIDRCVGACSGSNTVQVTEEGAVKVMGECSCCNPTGYTARPAASVACADGTGMQLVLYSINGCKCSGGKP